MLRYGEFSKPTNRPAFSFQTFADLSGQDSVVVTQIEPDLALCPTCCARASVTKWLRRLEAHILHRHCHAIPSNYFTVPVPGIASTEPLLCPGTSSGPSVGELLEIVRKLFVRSFHSRRQCLSSKKARAKEA